MKDCSYKGYFVHLAHKYWFWVLIIVCGAISGATFLHSDEMTYNQNIILGAFFGAALVFTAVMVIWWVMSLFNEFYNDYRKECERENKIEKSLQEHQ